MKYVWRVIRLESKFETSKTKTYMKLKKLLNTVAHPHVIHHIKSNQHFYDQIKKERRERSW